VLLLQRDSPKQTTLAIVFSSKCLEELGNKPGSSAFQQIKVCTIYRSKWKGFTEFKKKRGVIILQTCNPTLACPINSNAHCNQPDLKGLQFMGLKTRPPCVLKRGHHSMQSNQKWRFSFKKYHAATSHHNHLLHFVCSTLYFCADFFLTSGWLDAVFVQLHSVHWNKLPVYLVKSTLRYKNDSRFPNF